jgi:hypothetical protein
MLTEENLEEIGASLEYIPRKSLRRLAQETTVSKSSARAAAKLVRLKPFKARVGLVFT